jgi:hypothetical protein
MEDGHVEWAFELDEDPTITYKEAQTFIQREHFCFWSDLNVDSVGVRIVPTLTWLPKLTTKYLALCEGPFFV